MTTNAQLDRIKDKIRALSNVTAANGSSEAEVMKAAEVIGKLLQEHNLSMDEVAIRSEGYVEEKISATRNKGDSRKRVNGTTMALSAIATFTETKVWSTTADDRTMSYVFFGRASDVQMAKYLYEMIDTSRRAETSAYKKTEAYKANPGRGATRTFGMGFGARVARRLLDMHKANQEEEIQARGGSNSLVVLKEELLEKAFKELGMTFGKAKKTSQGKDAGAYEAGWVSGENVNLGRPISGDKEVRKLK